MSEVSLVFNQTSDCFVENIYIDDKGFSLIQYGGKISFCKLSAEKFELVNELKGDGVTCSTMLNDTILYFRKSKVIVVIDVKPIQKV